MGRSSIRRRLLSAMIGLATVPLLLAGATLGWRSYQQSVDEAYARKLEIARRVGVQVEGVMQRFQARIENGLRLADFAVADREGRHQALARLLADRHMFREIAFLDADGRDYLHLSNVRLLDRQQGVPLPIQETFRGAAERGETLLGPVYHRPGDNEPLMLLAVPVQDLRHGRLAGVVVAELRFRPIWHLIAGLDLSPGEDVYLLDDHNRVIAHRNPSIVLRETRVALQADRRRQKGLTGNEAFVALWPLTLGGKDFRVVVERDAREVLRPALLGLLLTGGVILVTVAGVFLIGVPLSRRISQPIVAVAETALAIRDGHLDRQAQVSGTDEIGQLAGAFNSMTARLRATVIDLETEVAQRTRTQQALEQLNRAYLALSMSNQAVTRAADETTLFTEACRIVREDCGYRLVWIGLAEHDAARTVRPVAQAGFEDGYLETVQITWADSERGRGPTGTAIRERRSVVCQDMLNDPRFAPWRAQALRRGYASSAAFPIRSGEQVYGALMVYAEEANAFQEQEVGLLSELAENIGFGIANLRAHADLARAKEMFQTVTEFATDWSYWRSADRHTFHYNAPACAAITGYAQEDFAADPELLDRLIHPEDRIRWDAHVADPGAVGSHEVQEYRILTRQGQVRWISHTCRPVIHADGSHLGHRGSNQDVTERKAAEAELDRYRLRLEELVTERTGQLRRQQSFVQAVLENLADGIVACDEQGNLSLFNRATREMHGTDLEALPPERWAEHYRLLAEDGATLLPKEQIPLFRAYQGQLVKNQEFVIERRDGSRLNILASGQAMVDDQGAKIGAVVAMHDVTAEKRAAAELQRAKEAAEAANRAKSMFLANMSHELRTPLNAILGFAQIMARDAAVTAEHGRELQTIDRAGRHLLSLINDVLEISRIEAGRTTLQKEVFSFTELLDGLEEMLRIRAEAKGLALRFERAPGLPAWVNGDAHHLRQVLINLLGNAVKYTEQGEVCLRVQPAGEQLAFEVADTGPGIPPEDQERIFQAFYQTEAGARKGEGTGLGLTISREFVRLMGGDLRVDSAPGQGSRFRFAIALPAAAAPADVPRPGRVLGLEPGQPARRVLVAEDNPDNRELICRLLEAVGFQVRVTADGQEAVEAFQAWRPDFVWMDMRMPVLDGYAATRRIRGLPGGREVRIAALTASAFEEDRQAILAAGCDDMVRKPIEEDRLFDTMGRLLGIRFRYAGGAPVEDVAPGGDLTALPDAARQELGRAAERLDEARMRRLVTDLQTTHPAEAQLIGRLVDDYRYDQLLALCEAKGKNS